MKADRQTATSGAAESVTGDLAAAALVARYEPIAEP
jgi:hypothetical protein